MLLKTIRITCPICGNKHGVEIMQETALAKTKSGHTVKYQEQFSRCTYHQTVDYYTDEQLNEDLARAKEAIKAFEESSEQVDQTKS